MNVPRRIAKALVGASLVACSAWAADGAGGVASSEGAGEVTTANGAVGVTTVEPRAFGYVVGDLMTRHVTVTTPASLELDPDSLPAAGRRGRALELHRVDVDRSERGGLRQLRLTLEYQVFLSPPAVRTLEMPPITLRFTGAPRDQDVRIDAWPVTVSPLMPPEGSSRRGLGELRPDAPPPSIDTGAHRQRLVAAGAVSALLMGWLAVAYLGLPGARRQRHFARAWRQVKPLDANASPPQRREAFRAVHQALNRTAGEVLFEHGVDRFVRQRPEFASIGDDLRAFFERSRREFFVEAPVDEGQARWLTGFARRCRDIERGTA